MLMLLVTGGGCNGEERRSLKNLVESNLVEAASNRESRGDCTAETCVNFYGVSHCYSTILLPYLFANQVALALILLVGTIFLTNHSKVRKLLFKNDLFMLPYPSL